MRCSLIVMMVFLSISGKGQSIEKTYRGQWASSFWTFEFHLNNRYSRTSSGHYGHTVVEGDYRIHNDTLELLNGFEHSSGTVNRYYVMDGNRIIDLEILYDYYAEDGFPISWKNKRIKIKQANGKAPKYRYKPEALNGL
ncbi:MAG: hypothetical protein RLZZ543_1767 [Bacteroidota bacterium]